MKTENDRITGKIAFYFNALDVSIQGFYEYLKNKDKHWKYEALDGLDIEILEERTIYRIIQKIGISHRLRKPKGLTNADKEALKSDDLLKRNFKSDEPNKKCVTNITELKASDSKLYVSAIFDCLDLLVYGLAMEINMKISLYKNVFKCFEAEYKQCWKRRSRQCPVREYVRENESEIVLQQKVQT